MLGLLEILILLLVLLVMAGLAVGAVVLLIWLARRGKPSPPVIMPVQPPTLQPPQSTPAPAKRKGRRFSFIEVREDGVRIRWGVCLVSLMGATLAAALAIELFLAIGGWKSERTLLTAIFCGVGSVSAWVILEWSQARKARSAQKASGEGVPAAGSPPPAGPSIPAACPRCGAALPEEAPQGLCPRCVLGVGLATQTEATGESGPHGTKVVQAPPEPGEIAKHFPQLEILECLGRGGMGVVYKARQPKLNRLVALKILAPEKGADPKFAERFLREAQALARLNHPNIVTVHDFGEAEGLYYLLMEYVDGMTLRQLLQGQKLAPEEALSIVPKICEALQFAHELGVVHRDIKPENVLVDRQGRVKIADFGIAKIVAAEAAPGGAQGTARPTFSLTQDQVIGTPHYMAPEQVEKPQLVDHRADIYSLGVVFYEMLTGELPLGKFQPPSKKVQVDVRLDEVVLHALEKEPERRYQHASEVKTAVETIAATPGTPAPAASPAGPPEVTPAMIGQYHRHLWVKAGCFCFAALCFLIATVSYTASDNTLAALLSAVATVFFGIAGYRHFSAAQQVGAGAAPSGGSRPAPTPAGTPAGPPVVIKRWRDAWPWNWEYIQLWLIVPLVVVGLALPFCLKWWGLRALWLLALELPGIAFAITYAVVGHRVRQTQAALPRTGGEIAECLMFRRPFESPGVAVMHEDRLELTPVVGSPITVVLADIVAVKEVRWFNSRRLWLKRGFVMDLATGQRVGVAVAEVFARRWRAKLSRGALPEIPAGSGLDQSLLTSAATKGWVTAVRWTARVLGTLLFAIYGLFLVGEGLPPIGSQPEGVQLSFVGVGLMLLGLVVGWKLEGAAALLIASGWTVFRIAEGGGGLGAFETPLLVGALYGLCWWATRGRRTHVVAGAVASLTMVLTLGQLFCPSSVFVRGVVTDAETTKPIAGAELTLEGSPVKRGEEGPRPDARSRRDGRFDLYVGWYAEQKKVSITAPGYETLTASLGPRVLGKRNVNRDYQLQKANAAEGEVARTDQRSPDPVLILRDNMAFDLDTQVTLEVSRERRPDPVQLSRTDVGWDNDGGGALMRNPYGKARLLPLPDASDFSDAVAKAGERRDLVAGSEDRGDVANKCRFFAVLTDQARLAVIEVQEFDAAQGTIRWRFLEEPTQKPPTVGVVPATGFSPTIERVLYSVGTQRPIKAEDLDSGREIELSAEVAANSEKEFFHWLAVQGADLLAFAHKQSWELWASPKLVGVPQAMWDQADSEALLSALRSGVMGLGRASLDVKDGFASYQVNESMVLPQTFAFQTRAGALGVLQITDFAESPRGMKIRYRLARSTGRSVAASGGKTERVQQKFVRLVVDKAAMTFEGQPTTWEGVGALLDQVTDRTNTVLEFAVTSDQITVQEQNEWRSKCVALARTHGFKFASFIGVHELGSKGTGAAGDASGGAPSTYVTAALAGMDLAVEKVREAAAKGGLADLADVFNHFNELCDQLQGKNQNRPTGPQDWGTGELAKFRAITNAVSALEDAAERMRDVARSTGLSKAEREQALRESLPEFLGTYWGFKAWTSTAIKPEAKSDEDFVAQHRAELGQKALDAARAFVEEHKWKMRSEFGDQGRVVLRAADAAGKQIMFEEATMADGTARFTIIAEPGAELSAQRIGAVIWRRLGWVHERPGVAAQVAPPPVARAEAGTYQVTLANGITVEVVAVARDPLRSWLWWKPDGTPLPQPPGEAGEFRPAGMWTRKSVGSNDCAILVRCDGRLAPHWQSRRDYTPRVELLGQLGVKGAGMAEVVRFPAGTKEAAIRVTTATGPWEPVAVFDGSRTRVLIEGIQVLCTHLRHDPDGKCLDVSHNVDRGQYALRMMARFKGVGRREVGLHSGVLSARETQGYVFLDPSEPDLRAGDMAEFVLERTPWVSGEIAGIALASRPETTLRPPSFGPAIERELGGWPSLDCTVLDLDQGRLLVVPTNTVAASMNNPRPLLNWMVQQGADLDVAMGAGAGLHLDDGVLVQLAGTDASFDSVAALTVRRQLAGGGGKQDVSIPRDELKTQPVFVYRTREGGMGVLQVLGPSQNPRSLRIRFKAALPLE